jgi:hypothetical protein
MASPAKPGGQLSKVVVAFLDGRRARGYVLDFSPMRDEFTLLPRENPMHERGEKCALVDLKAVFFVKDYTGNKDYRPPEQLGPPPQQGRKIEVIFKDGETLLGTTQGYNPTKLGFFMFPADGGDNNMRVFVVNRNAMRVKLVT